MNDDNYIDFVAVGSKGAASTEKDSQQYVGSVATLVLTARNMNCIFVPWNIQIQELCVILPKTNLLIFLFTQIEIFLNGVLGFRV